MFFLPVTKPPRTVSEGGGGVGRGPGILRMLEGGVSEKRERPFAESASFSGGGEGQNQKKFAASRVRFFGGQSGLGHE